MPAKKKMKVKPLGKETIVKDDTQEVQMKNEFEISLQATGEEGKRLETFFAGVESLKEVMKVVKENTEKLKRLISDYDESGKGPAEKQKIHSAINSLKNKNELYLEEMRSRTLDLKSIPFTGDDFRKLQHNLINGLNIKSAKYLLNYKNALNTYNEIIKEETWREMKEQEVNDYELVSDQERDMMNDSSSSSSMLQENEQVGDFMQRVVFREQAVNAKRYLEEKQRELQTLERNLLDLSELMKDFAIMVESANEPLEQIDTYLQETKVMILFKCPSPLLFNAHKSTMR